MPVMCLYKQNLSFQVDDTYGISITNEQALNWSIRVALYLKKLNLNHNDIVGISAKNSTYLLPTVLGCSFSGVPFHAVNPDLDKGLSSFLVLLRHSFCVNIIFSFVNRYISTLLWLDSAKSNIL